jgi:hypothetical protein
MPIDIVSGEEIRALCIEQGFPANSIKIADGDYAIPTEEAIQSFGNRFGSFLWGAGLDKWVEEIWDCDDFALTAKSLAAIDNAIWQKKTGNDFGLGFGIVWVALAESGHAINIALGRDANNKLELRYYEPQMQASNKIGEPFVWLQRKSRDYFVSPLWCYW